MSKDAKKNKTPSHCKDCALFWTHGVSVGSYDRWCCHYSKPAIKAVKMCISKGTKVTRAND